MHLKHSPVRHFIPIWRVCVVLQHTAASNASFDASLRRRNPAWGVRDIADIQACAGRHGLELDQVIPMPANNFVLCFARSTQEVGKSGV